MKSAVTPIARRSTGVAIALALTFAACADTVGVAPERDDPLARGPSPARRPAPEIGLPFVQGRTYDARAADFDRDGRTDLVVTTHEGWIHPDGIWQQRPNGSFELVFPFLPAANDRHGCATGDVNGDGREDVYCQTGVSEGTGVSANELWIQQPGGAFLERAGAWGVADEYGRGRLPIFFDHDGDGRLDLYTTVWGDRTDDEVNRNRLWINEGDRFVERTTVATENGVGSACLDSGDFDVDGRRDLVVCGETLRLLRNDGSGHEDASFLLGDPVAWPQDARLVDLDRDGLLDLVVVSTGSVQIRFNRGSDPRFGTVHAGLSLTKGMRVAVADLTADGVLDVYVAEGCRDGVNAPDVLLEGPDWVVARAVTPNPTEGCGNIPVAIDGRILVFAGGPGWAGPVTWRSPAPAVVSDR
jgi:hypothetical protein